MVIFGACLRHFRIAHESLITNINEGSIKINMETVLTSPASYKLLGTIPMVIFSLLIILIGGGFFLYIILRRIRPLFKAAPSAPIDQIWTRIQNTFNYAHHRMLRYKLAAMIHFCFLFGLSIISLRWLGLLIIGIWPGIVDILPVFLEIPVDIYMYLSHFVGTVVFIACIVAMIRRGIFRPERYAVPERFGKSHTPETIFALFMVALLMAGDMIFQGSAHAAKVQAGAETGFLIPGTGVWVASKLLNTVSIDSLQGLHVVSYYFHEILFFVFICFIPFSRFFHIFTFFPDLFLMKLNKGSVKPVRWGVSDDKLDELESFGVQKLEDFSWKYLLDFMTCADCGRCSDHCPANAVGRPLSPRFISIKGRDLMYKNYPILGKGAESKPLIGDIYDEAEIWSCTTCGACEEECPLTIEYIDKMVDLRRGMVDEGNVPQSLQKPLSAIEKRGNPWGKMEKNRADWTTAENFAEEVPVKILDGSTTADTLYFVDSITSYDDRMQEIARATARVLAGTGTDFGILGKDEKDSGHEVRRFGEEMLFQDLKEHNTEMILDSGAKQIVTADPHAFNALKKDYKDMPPVEHISQFIDGKIKDGSIKLKTVENPEAVYTYHDPCYLGRHNLIYDTPREVIDAIPGLKRVEMERCRDRSFCCSGGGLMLFYEPEEEERMGVIRVKMAKEAGATVIVTACPFCLVNVEDAIKIAGLEDEMAVLDLVELIDRHMVK